MAFDQICVTSYKRIQGILQSCVTLYRGFPRCCDIIQIQRDIGNSPDLCDIILKDIDFILLNSWEIHSEKITASTEIQQGIPPDV